MYSILGESLNHNVHRIHARERVEKLFLPWKELQKAVLRKTDTQIRKEEKFTADLDKLFDIVHAKVVNLITIEG